MEEKITIVLQDGKYSSDNFAAYKKSIEKLRQKAIIAQNAYLEQMEQWINSRQLYLFNSKQQDYLNQVNKWCKQKKDQITQRSIKCYIKNNHSTVDKISSMPSGREYLYQINILTIYPHTLVKQMNGKQHFTFRLVHNNQDIEVPFEDYKDKYSYPCNLLGILIAEQIRFNTLEKVKATQYSTQALFSRLFELFKVPVYNNWKSASIKQRYSYQITLNDGVKIVLREIEGQQIYIREKMVYNHVEKLKADTLNDNKILIQKIQKWASYITYENKAILNLND